MTEGSMDREKKQAAIAQAKMLATSEGEAYCVLRNSSTKGTRMAMYHITSERRAAHHVGVSVVHTAFPPAKDQR